MNEPIKAIVQRVVPKGPHGPFAVATSESFQGGSITFSLEPTVWQDRDWPKEGSVVCLWNLREKRLGWRAKKGRSWRLSDEQTAERKKAMSAMSIDPVVLAIKALLEQSSSEIKHLGIETSLLQGALKTLVRMYVSNGDLKFAMKAAELTGEAEDARTVLGAVKTAKEPEIQRVGIQGAFEQMEIPAGCLQMLLQCGTEAELRAYIAQSEGKMMAHSHTLAILKKLSDAHALFEMGQTKAAQYFSELEEQGRTHVYKGSTDILLSNAIESYRVAIELGHEATRSALLELGDRLQALHGVGVKYYSGSILSSNNEDPALCCYKAAQTTEGWRRVAECYCLMSENRSATRDPSKKSGYLSQAAEAYLKAGDKESAVRVSRALAQQGMLAMSLRIRKEAGEVIGPETLKQTLDLSLANTGEEVRKSVLEYLGERSENGVPFPTAYTFWHYSQSNDEWHGYLCAIERISGRFDVGNWGETVTSIAKPLYSSSKAEIMGEIHDALLRHLLVGWMMSAVAYEIEISRTGRRVERKYDHPSYAAWRTFEAGVKNTGYYPFNHPLHLESNRVIQELYNSIARIFEESSARCVKKDGLLTDTQASNTFMASKLPEMLVQLQVVYRSITEEVKGLIAKL